MAEKLIYILFSLPGLSIIIAATILNLRGSCSGRIKRSMGAMLYTVALSMLCYAQFYNQGLAARYSWGFDFVYCLVTPFCAPLYYVAVNCLTDIKRRPALNVAEASVAYTWMVLVAKKIFSIFMPAQGILVMIYGEFRLNVYTRMLEDYNVSYTSGKSIKMRGIHVLTILVVVTGLIMSSIPISESTNHLLLVSVAVLGQIIMVSLIVSYVMKLEYSAEEMKKYTEEPDVPVQPIVRPRPAAAPIAAPVMAERKEERTASTLIEKIDDAMLNDNLFLQPDLSLVTLCEKVGTNRTYASKAIKDAKGCNFPDYVNQFRLEYAVKIMKNTAKDDIVIQNIALQCGFGSIQTFYRYFKLFYKETPTQWIERNK